MKKLRNNSSNSYNNCKYNSNKQNRLKSSNPKSQQHWVCALPDLVLRSSETDAELYEQIEKLLHTQKHSIMKQIRVDSHEQDELQTSLLNHYMKEDLPKQLQGTF